ncbi:hypothetical protein BGZ94_006572 [Podila epigama]|nr:hypothetical protein BGZ94_006572 [Podila epigama]
MPPQLKDIEEQHASKIQNKHTRPPSVHQQPSLWNRIYLTGFIHRPIDLYFIAHALCSIIWTLFQLFLVEIPLLVRTQFTTNSPRHPISWGPIYSFCMAVSRASSNSVQNVAQLRLVSNIITLFIPLRMLHLWRRKYSVKTKVAFNVHLETLLEPERLALQKTRSGLGHHLNKRTGRYQNPSPPTSAFFASFLPDHIPKGQGQAGARLANLPEESGALDQDGTYTLSGEWIEVLDESRGDTNTDAKTSTVTLLYLHGGGHAFCSAAFHRQLVTRLVLEFGPGARAFVVDYRLAPEHPFPAAVHDVYAAYLYLTQPDHPAIDLLQTAGRVDHPLEPIRAEDIVLAGDSAGAGLAIAFSLYMRDYVQPTLERPLLLPTTTILLSAWTDISTSMPSATGLHSYCYVPCSMGVNPFSDQTTFESFPQYNFARNYVCGDSYLAPNERTQSKALEWEWYRHLAQHPMVSPVYTANLANIRSHTILQAGAFDRLVDDTKLYAHKLGQANASSMVRYEVYQDQVHVFQFFEFLPMARQALQSIVAFVEDARRAPNTEGSSRSTKGSDGQTEWIVVDYKGTVGEGFEGTSIAELDTFWKKKKAD